MTDGERRTDDRDHEAALRVTAGNHQCGEAEQRRGRSEYNVNGVHESPNSCCAGGPLPSGPPAVTHGPLPAIDGAHPALSRLSRCVGGSPKPPTGRTHQEEQVLRRYVSIP